MLGACDWQWPGQDDDATEKASRALSSGVDLTVRVVDTPPSVMPYAGFTVTAEVCNGGDTPAHGLMVDVRVSNDADISISDPFVGDVYVSWIGAGACQTLSIPVSAMGDVGSHHVGAIVDASDFLAESDEGNNISAAVTVLFGYDADLRVTALSGPTAATPGASFTVQATVCNDGQSWAGGTSVDLYLSTDSVIDETDWPVGNAWIGSLEMGECRDVEAWVYPGLPDGVYTLGAVVDPYHNVIELDEDNNAMAGSAIGLGYQADLVVTAVSSPPSALPWSSFESTVTLCNRGTTASYGNMVGLYLSTDDDVTTDDFLAGLAYSGFVDPGQCTTLVAPSWAGGDEGAYWLGAIADPNDAISEFFEDNNAHAGAVMGIGHGADLVVSQVSGPTTAAPGQPITIAVEICNRGQAPSSYGGWASVAVLLSSDSLITMSDELLGMHPVPDVLPGACTIIDVPANVYSMNGVYTLGAIVDPWNNLPEIIESNNATAGDVLGVGHEADLVVTAISGPPSALPGQQLEVLVTACNVGQSTSGYAHIEVVLSADGTISTTDQWLGANSFSDLWPGQCITLPVPGYHWGPDGVFTLGAIVDAHDITPEIIETNNTLAGDHIGIGLGPDLVVSAVTGPATAMPWNSVDIVVTVCNQGTDMSYGTDVEVVLSSDASITTADVPIGSRPAGWLAPGACEVLTVPCYPGADPGAYRLGALVDAYDYQDELIDDNNATAGGVLGIGYEPELIVTSVTGPATVRPGDAFEVEAEVCNQGQSTSYGAWIDLFLSTDGTITTEDVYIGGQWTGDLAPGQCAPVSVATSVWQQNGIYRLGGIVDAWNGMIEIIENNNTLAGSFIGIGYEPDLVITAVTGPATIWPYSSFLAAVTVCNQGQSPAYGSGVDLYLSPDSAITQADLYAGWAPVAGLDPGQCEEVTINAYSGAAPGVYQLGGIVDPWNGTIEILENNNALAGSSLGIGYQPDLVVTAVSGPGSAMLGSSFDVTVTVCNQGQDTSYPTDVDVRFSSDGMITSADPVMMSAPIDTLAPGACQTVTTNVYANQPGNYTLGSVVDPHSNVFEIDEGNNARAGNAISIGPC